MELDLQKFTQLGTEWTAPLWPIRWLQITSVNFGILMGYSTRQKIFLSPLKSLPSGYD
jgi:hypothetical protein